MKKLESYARIAATLFRVGARTDARAVWERAYTERGSYLSEDVAAMLAGGLAASGDETRARALLAKQKNVSFVLARELLKLGELERALMITGTIKDSKQRAEIVKRVLTSEWAADTARWHEKALQLLEPAEAVTQRIAAAEYYVAKKGLEWQPRRQVVRGLVAGTSAEARLRVLLKLSQHAPVDSVASFLEAIATATAPTPSVQRLLAAAYIAAAERLAKEQVSAGWDPDVRATGRTLLHAAVRHSRAMPRQTDEQRHSLVLTWASIGQTGLALRSSWHTGAAWIGASLAAQELESEAARGRASALVQRAAGFHRAAMR